MNKKFKMPRSKVAIGFYLVIVGILLAYLSSLEFVKAPTIMENKNLSQEEALEEIYMIVKKLENII